VLDPSINSEQMEMYADVEARAGVLGSYTLEHRLGMRMLTRIPGAEPEGIVEIKSMCQLEYHSLYVAD
jgi:hypothetical protein